jgi:hypothetical protein
MVADRMTTAELFAAIVAALKTVFTGSAFKVWPGPPDQTALPAVWPELENTFTGPGRNAGGVMTVRLVAAIAPQVSAAEYAALLEAHDRFDQITAGALNTEITSRAGGLTVVQIGGVDHTALAYSLTASRSLPC